MKISYGRPCHVWLTPHGRSSKRLGEEVVSCRSTELARRHACRFITQSFLRMTYSMVFPAPRNVSVAPYASEFTTTSSALNTSVIVLLLLHGIRELEDKARNCYSNTIHFLLCSQTQFPLNTTQKTLKTASTKSGRRRAFLTPTRFAVGAPTLKVVGVG